MNKLLQMGFVSVGNWQLNHNSINMNLNSYQEANNVIYGFIIDAVPKYFGITRNALRTRMYQYSNPGRNQSTNIRINKLLLEALQADHLVEIYAFKDTGIIQYGGFSINLALGLEETLINSYQTEWNYRGNKRILEVENKNIELELNDVEDVKTEVFEDVDFEINLVKAYKQGGFINIPAKYSDLFPDDRENLYVHFGNKMIQGFVDRRNNNGYPRIQVGVELRNWIRSLSDDRSRLGLKISKNNLYIS